MVIELLDKQKTPENPLSWVDATELEEGASKPEEVQWIQQKRKGRPRLTEHDKQERQSITTPHHVKRNPNTVMTRGIANAKSQNRLSSLLKKWDPDLVGIAEPKTNSVPTSWHEDLLKPRNAHFRYLNMWTSHPNFMDVVQENWQAQMLTKDDEILWEHSPTGKITAATAYEVVRQKGAKPVWAPFLWKASLHPRTVAISWNFFGGTMHTDDRLQAMTFKIASSNFLPLVQNYPLAKKKVSVIHLAVLFGQLGCGTSKACSLEPFFNASASQFILGQQIPLSLWLSLAPVVIGQKTLQSIPTYFSYASSIIVLQLSDNIKKKRKLCTPSRTGALGVPSSKNGDMVTLLALILFADTYLLQTDMDSTNLYAYISIIALIVCIPPAIILEGPQLMKHGISDAIAKVGMTKFISDLFWVGMFYHLYNQG
ncbi:hypothetical protein IFM89_031746 [Coptis chinensis]|uniref:Sugar phosphate transporter domain-containing protein n=1 Tax=Coptis chinensis TaxID=261450 RepID=A0A835H1Z7_9MAGN|nr:hypothetical protein IFM89_031746 [Coptis chinensis]